MVLMILFIFVRLLFSPVEAEAAKFDNIKANAIILKESVLSGVRVLDLAVAFNVSSQDLNGCVTCSIFNNEKRTVGFWSEDMAPTKKRMVNKDGKYVFQAVFTNVDLSKIDKAYVTISDNRNSKKLSLRNILLGYKLDPKGVSFGNQTAQTLWIAATTLAQIFL